MRGFVLLAFILLLSGCTEGGQSKDDPSNQPAAGSDETADPSNPTESSSKPGGGNSSIPVPLNLRLTDCVGVAVRFIWPADSAPAGAEVPPGWETAEAMATDHLVQLTQCQRISVGPFERGPVNVLLELHDKIAPPEACLDFGGQDYSDVQVLRKIWVDDPEIVSYLTASAGMPALYGEFTFAPSPTGGTGVFTWDWGVPGQAHSTLAYSRVDTVPGGSASTARIFWHNGQAAFLMDLHEEEDRPAVSTLNAVAVLKAPMMHPLPEFGAASGIYSLVDAGAYEAALQTFGGMACEQPSQ